LLQRHFLSALQVSIGLNEYRQLATAFMNAKLNHKIALTLDEVIQDDVNLFDAQAGHSTKWRTRIMANRSTRTRVLTALC
jgi:hypothetical protein